MEDAQRTRSTPSTPRSRYSRAARVFSLSTLGLVLFALSGTAAAQGSSMAKRTLRPEHTPSWVDAPVLRELHLDRDLALDDNANGVRLRAAVQSLQPGDRLVVGAGRWSVDSHFEVNLNGTAAAPIRIEARAGATPVLTRPDAWQNIVNFGSQTSTPRFVLLRGFELTGGSIGVRVYRGDDLWIDQCRIHHVGGDAVRASNYDTARLYVTRSEIHHTAQVDGTGEGFYLGANFGTAISREAVIASNHVHHTGGQQGDGIELKQGSYGCTIAENIVHDTLYPGIIVYGTDGAPRNVIESNVIWSTVESPLQVQGEALVRNNVVFGGARAAFISHDQQGQVRDLEVVHNTFVTTSGEAARLQNWGGRPGMVLANNALYSESGASLSFLSGANGVTIVGNVVHGPTSNAGGAVHILGAGAEDFVDLSFDAARRDAHPSRTSALLGAAHAAFPTSHDASGAERTQARAVGAFERGTYGRYLGASLPGAPWLRSSGPPAIGGSPLTLTLAGGPASNFGVVGVQLVSATGAPLPGHPPIERTIIVLDGIGEASLDFTPPANAGPGGGPVVGNVRAQVRDATVQGGISVTQWIEWLMQ